MLSLTHLILVLLVIFVLFGAGKLPKVMGDIGKGIKNLREELSAEEKGTQTLLPPPAKKKAPAKRKAAAKSKK